MKSPICLYPKDLNAVFMQCKFLVFLAVATALWSSSSMCPADDTQDKLKAIYAKYTQAEADGNGPRQFDLLMEMNAVSPNDTMVNLAIAALYKTVIPTDPRTGKTVENIDQQFAKGLPPQLLSRAWICPRPTPSKKDAIVLLEYAMVRYGLMVHVHNVDRDLDTAAALLAEVETDAAKAAELSPALAGPSAGIRSHMRGFRKTIGANRIALGYDRIRQGLVRLNSAEKPASALAPEKPPAQEFAVTEKTFTVITDPRAKETEVEAAGTNHVTLRSPAGKIVRVSYTFSYPRAYLIEAGGDLTGKRVTIYFKEDVPESISCGSGNGRCKIKSYNLDP